MRRMARAAVIGVGVVFAFLFLVPAVQVTFSQPPAGGCTNSNGQLTSLCSSIGGHGYGSITYWLFGMGGFYFTQYRLIL
ncbi:MAG TPA: hypothetical protein VGS11_10585 [Candidatus Bathyarchaeia archaeon]|nr:hypothetical protein [Candidatus Bathyarchaeia archaeon]